ncbi:MAG: glycine--tRNA ligase [Parachlamydia sp.]|jgi:glycyl-tRNA synthetase|nr:glycine--tRNA ligase [Parachlamydia sp.]
MEEVQIGQDALKSIVALCKRRGFIYPGSDIYGGFANTYSYGPYGVELKKNIKDLWWKRFINFREDMIGLDGPILLHPKAWEASGHVDGFNDALIDCKACKSRFRVDHLIENTLKMEVEGLSIEKLNEIVRENAIPCPKCEKTDWTDARYFNLMFMTKLSKTDQNGENGIAYLRPETAQAIFLDFKNIIDTVRIQIPFGVGQIGKAFRNEITPGNFIFRVIEFEQMEIEYFIPPQGWEGYFEEWLAEMQAWCKDIGLSQGRLTLFEHPKEKLSHYSKRTVDILYDFPFGRQELYGLAYRTDFDLSRHSEFAKAKLEYTDPKTREKFIPHVIEPTFGLDRTILALLCEAYEEEKLPDGETRTVLHLLPSIAPVKAAIFPLMRKEELLDKSRSIYRNLRNRWNVQHDETGAIGKRYRRQDEVGTPYCITVDYESLENNTVTVRERDSMKQERMAIDHLAAYLAEKLDPIS